MFARMLAFALLALPLLQFRAPPPPPPDTHVELTDAVTQPEVRRAAVMLQLLRAGRGEGPLGDPALQQAIKDAFRNNPNASPDELLQKLAANDPDLAAAAAPLAKQWLGNGRNLPPATGKAPAPGSPPTPPQPAPKSDDPATTPPETPPETPASGPTTPRRPPVPKAGPGPDTPGPTRTRDQMSRPESPADPGAADAARQTRQDRQYEAFKGMWEKYAGPLSQTPAFQDVLKEFVKGVRPDGGRDAGNSPLNALLGVAADAPAAAGWVERNLGGLSFDVPTRPGGDVSLPSAGGLSLSGDGLAFSGAPSALVVAVLAVGAGLAAWWAWRRQGAARARRESAGFGAWPVPPGSLASRDDLVRAFDHLGLVALGLPARHWHHRAVAAGLAARSPADGRAADDLADLYELARYAPAGDPFPLDRLPAAGVILIRLARRPA